MPRTIARLAVFALFFTAQATWADAAEIKVFSTTGIKSVGRFPKFEKTSSHKLNVTWSTAALLTKKVEFGEQADALVLIKNNVESLLKEGKIVSGTETLFGRANFAVGVKPATRNRISPPRRHSSKAFCPPKA